MKSVEMTLQSRPSRKQKKIQSFIEQGNDYCPLCTTGLTLFNSSLEHAPPKKISGENQPVCITCRSCNNKYGRKVEAAMDRHNRNVVFMKGYSQTGELSMSGELDMNVDKDTRIPSGKVLWVERSLDLQDTTSIFIPDSEHSIAGLGWLKSMYLLAGAATHGDIWKSTWSENIRDILMDRKNLDQFIGRIYMKPVNPHLLKANRKGVLFIGHYAKFKCYLISWQKITVIFGDPGLFDKMNKKGLSITVNKCIEGPFIFGSC